MFRAVVRQDGSLQLGEEARRQGYGPGAVVDVIVTRAGSLILALDQSPALDAASLPLLSAGTVREARALRAGQTRRRAG